MIYLFTILLLFTAILAYCFFVEKDLFHPLSLAIAKNGMIGLVLPIIAIIVGARDVEEIQSPLAFLMIFSEFAMMWLGVLMISRLNQGLPKFPYAVIQEKHIAMWPLYALLLLGAVLFFALTQISGIGFLAWLASPRKGYAETRIGFGPIYNSVAFCFITATTIAAYLKYRYNSSRANVVLILGPFFLFFLASKGSLLATVLYIFIARHYFKKKITILSSALLFLGILAFFGFMHVLFSDGADDMEFLTKVAMYADYLFNSTYFYSTFEQHFSHTYGSTFLSSFWRPIPRILFPAKPIVYGAITINDVLWPGLAEDGYTPAFWGSVDAYLDFGLIGPPMMGLFSGMKLGIIYKYFRENSNFFGYALLGLALDHSILPGFDFFVTAIATYLISYAFFSAIKSKVR